MNSWVFSNGPLVRLLRILLPDDMIVPDPGLVLNAFTDFRTFLDSIDAPGPNGRTWKAISMMLDHRLKYSRWADHYSNVALRYMASWPPRREKKAKLEKGVKTIIDFYADTSASLTKMIDSLNRMVSTGRRFFTNDDIIGTETFDFICRGILVGLDYRYTIGPITVDFRSISSSIIPVPQMQFQCLDKPDFTNRPLPPAPDTNFHHQYFDDKKTPAPPVDISHLANPNVPLFDHELTSIIGDTTQHHDRLFIIEANTGTGKSLCIPALLSRKGIVIVVVHHRLHGRRLSSHMNLMFGTKQTAFIDDAHISSTEKVLGCDPVWTGYVPLQEVHQKNKVIVVMTYKTAAKYLHRGQYPSFIVLDDIYVDSEERNFFLMCLKDKMTSLARHTKIIGTNAAVPGYPRNLLRRIPGTNFTVRSMSNLQGPGNIIDMDHLSRGVYASLCEVFHTHLSQAEITDFEQTARGRELLDVFQNPKNQQVVNDIYNTVERGEITYAQVLEYWIDNYQTLYRPDDFYELIAEVKRMRGEILPEPVLDVINLYLHTCFSKPLSHPGVMLVFVRDAVKVRELCAAVNNTFAQQEIEVIPLTESGESEAIYKAGLDLLKSTRSEYRPRVVISDSIAESSVTIPNVTFVIDTNETSSEITDLTGTRVRFSKTLDDQARKQRRGRTGRTNSGFYYNLRLNDAPSQQPIVDSLPFGDMKKTLLEYIDFLRGTRILKTELLTRLEARFPTGGNMENAVAGHIWEYIYSQLLNEGSLIDVKKNDGLEVYITHLGRLILNFPGNYKESRLVAIGAFCGVFRNIIAYVVISRDLDSLENQPILARWFDSFNNSANDRMFDESYIQKIIDMAYILGREANEQVMALKMGIDPHMVYRWRRAMRSFEEVMSLSITIPGEQHFLSFTFNPNANLSSIVTTLFALMAGSGEDILLSDKTRGLRATLYNRIIEDETSESSETDVQYLSTFCRLQDNPNGSTEVLGTTTIPAVIACLGFDVFTVRNNERITSSNPQCMSINLLGFYNGGDIIPFCTARRHLRAMFLGILDASNSNGLIDAMRIIDNYYYSPRCPEYNQQTQLWISSMRIAPYALAKEPQRASLSIPPFATQNRKLFCFCCLAPGHRHDHCITSPEEIRTRIGNAKACFVYGRPRLPEEDSKIRDAHTCQSNIAAAEIGRFVNSLRCGVCENLFHKWSPGTFCQNNFKDGSFCFICNQKNTCRPEKCVNNNHRCTCRFPGCTIPHLNIRHQEHIAILYLRNTGMIKFIDGWSGPQNDSRSRFLDAPYRDFVF